MPLPASLCDWSLRTECYIIAVIDLAYRITATVASYMEPARFTADQLYSWKMIIFYIGIITTVIMIGGAFKGYRPYLWQWIVVGSIRLILIIVGYGYMNVYMNYFYDEANEPPAWTNTATDISDLVPCYNNFWFCACVPALCMCRVYMYIRKLSDDENRPAAFRSPIVVYKQEFVPAPPQV